MSGCFSHVIQTTNTHAPNIRAKIAKPAFHDFPNAPKTQIHKRGSKASISVGSLAASAKDFFLSSQGSFIFCSCGA